MASLRRISLPYHRDSCDLFARLKHLPYPVFLDSAAPFSEFGRYDILCAQPEEVISLNTINYDDINTFLIKTEQRLNQLCDHYSHNEELPFCGGAIGYLSYDLAEISQSIGGKQRASIDPPTPLFHAGIYPWAIIVDHGHQECELVAQPGVNDATLAHIQKLIAMTLDTNPEPQAFKLLVPFRSTLNRTQYGKAFDRIQNYIRAGDCYQINLTRGFTAKFAGDPWLAYQGLRETAAAPFSAYLDLGSSQILSFSPERLLSADQDGHLQTQPIKGTAARDPDPEIDRALATALQESTKNRAENVMIVDLLRNDFSKSCQASSVHTEQLCELQSFRTVHHLVSTVSGQLRADCTPFKALLNCFPGGSITGAPKQRAMEIIREIEPHRRNIYCGSVFYMGGGGKMDSNITIRSFVCADKVITGWAGGGIVADSEVEEEFTETKTKIGKLLKALADL
ncbi:aminodeoxychorismate synthase component I [Zhongshania aquimaris]|uniref:Aminodeoxychorismate synthase component I n=1 Tax=Zhongshania aquimaris TaxID=2857107 RepID=A0ABS6VT80_9GAMM|nr:aminodeoxychorismate synthase component I [Zhongshania aquimaris]MBW2941529.1 aminodeoxychorismate synthase component I [Zhongshania aquimaris]